jgi:hypothetical protein
VNTTIPVTIPDISGLALHLALLKLARATPDHREVVRPTLAADHGDDWLHQIMHDGYRLIVQHEGSHATPSASAATTTSLSGHFGFSV